MRDPSLKPFPPAPAPVRGLLVATPECRIQFANPEVWQWLKAFFGRAPRAGRLPRKICRWLSAEVNAPSTAKPLIVRRGKATLFVHRHRPHPAHSISLLFELSHGHAVKLRRPCGGLTRRETEVLHWVAEGKSNNEIAAILGITPATVGRHLERVYPKLGVENRISAANVAAALSRRLPAS